MTGSAACKPQGRYCAGMKTCPWHSNGSLSLSADPPLMHNRPLSTNVPPSSVQPPTRTPRVLHRTLTKGQKIPRRAGRISRVSPGLCVSTTLLPHQASTEPFLKSLSVNLRNLSWDASQNKGGFEKTSVKTREKLAILVEIEKKGSVTVRPFSL